MRRRRWPRRWESSRASSRAWHASSPRPRAVSRWRAGSRPSTRTAPQSWRRRTSSTTSRARSARRSSSGRTTASGDRGRGRGRGRFNTWPTSCPTRTRAQGLAQFGSEPWQRGGIYGEAPLQRVRLASGVAQLTATPPALAGGPGETVLTVFPSIGLYDGRGANKPWLQELPDPVSKITWHAWVEVHPATAARWGVTNGDFLLLKSPHGAVGAPAWITPGIRPDGPAAPPGAGHQAYCPHAKDRSF